jgi:exonuclease III
MGIGFPKPRFRYDYSLRREKERFDRFFADPDRPIPAKKRREIDLATWNIANLGLQKRRDKDLKLIAHMLSKFDIIAVQEVNANLGHFNKIMKNLGNRFDMRVSDVAGSQERLAVVFRTDRLEPRQLFGELDYNPNGKIVDGKYVISPKRQKLRFGGKTVILPFYNFNRNPFLSTWKVRGRRKSFLLANVHIYFGEASKSSARYDNRVSEVYYLAEWARKQQTASKRKNLYETNVILLGDMNVPRMKSDDKVFRALKRRGLQPTSYSSEAGTTLQEFNTYDQIVFSNKNLEIQEIRGGKAVVVDFDNFLFADLWSDPRRDLKDFKAWTRFAVSDHRPVFVRLKV